jgi:excinuclease UvrABC nuclease subunit
VGIAKGVERKKNEIIYIRTTKNTKLRNERIGEWIDDNKNLLIRVRDEAHRFAISYQRKLRNVMSR